MFAAPPPLTSNVSSVASTYSSYSSPFLVRVLCYLVCWFCSAKIEEGWRESWREKAKKKMRPILMNGHERPLTFLRYDQEGDLLFSCAKDPNLTSWFTDNGERLSTYRGHNGVVW